MPGLSATQRTMRALREKGGIVAVVEKWNPYGGAGHGVRQDLFGIIDVLLLDPVRGVVGIQCCTTSVSEHYRKLTEECAQSTTEWLSTPGTSLEIWGWRKIRKTKGGKAMIWQPRIVPISLEDVK